MVLTGGGLGRDGVVMEAMVALEERGGVEEAVRPVVDELGGARVQQEGRAQAARVPSRRILQEAEPRVRGKQRERLQDLVVVAGGTKQEKTRASAARVRQDDGGGPGDGWWKRQAGRAGQERNIPVPFAIHLRVAEAVGADLDGLAEWQEAGVGLPQLVHEHAAP